MFYRMIRIHFEDARFDELVTWAGSVTAKVEAIDGFMFGDLVQTGSGEGMVIAAYESEASFQAAADTVAEVMGEMAGYLTGPPHIHAGTVALSYGR